MVTMGEPWVWDTLEVSNELMIREIEHQASFAAQFGPQLQLTPQQKRWAPRCHRWRPLEVAWRRDRRGIVGDDSVLTTVLVSCAGALPALVCFCFWPGMVLQAVLYGATEEDESATMLTLVFFL
ncbi:hypothetical protein SETIT_2G078200v2 [Setaria italica]|uniref:Uncharacterized protein n=2 Tax=Setaria TaxID=4554 RepID=A0A368PWK3_SETIT|nr:hypothetical protein SETIT_2G078200v2 [Setaria italica]TKW31064.1 hypothetical protein SEVIR_2G080500v2 [Setaria viridis]